MRPVLAVGGMSPAVEVFAPLAQAGVRLRCLDPIAYAAVPPLADPVRAELAQLSQAVAQWGDAVELVGYSAGASLSLLYALTEPARVARLHLLEPPWAGQAQARAEADLLTALDQCFANAHGADFLAGFVMALMAPGVYPELAPSDPADWQWQRPPRAAPLWTALRASTVSNEALSAMPIPVELHSAGRSHPGFAAIVRRLLAQLPAASHQHWPQADHFDLPTHALPALRRMLF